MKQILLARQLKFEEGKLTIFGQLIIMMPAYTIVTLQKFVETKVKNGKEIIYQAAKQAGVNYVSKFKKEFSPPNQQHLLQTCLNLLSLGGSGKIKILKFDFEKHIATFNVVGSPWVIERKEKTKYPVDFFLAGFFAGGAEVIFEDKIDVVETKCQAMSGSWCEFETVSPKQKRMK